MNHTYRVGNNTNREFEYSEKALYMYVQSIYIDIDIYISLAQRGTNFVFSIIHFLAVNKISIYYFPFYLKCLMGAVVMLSCAVFSTVTLCHGGLVAN